MGYKEEKLRIQNTHSASKRPEPKPPAGVVWKIAQRTGPPPGHPLPGNVGKWIRNWQKENSSRVSAKLEEGWFFPKRSAGANGKQVVADQGDISSAIQRGDAIWMEMKKEMKVARDRHFWELSQHKKADVSDPEAEAALERLGVQV